MGGGTQCTLGRGGVTAVAHRARCNARAGPRWCHVSRAQPNLRNWRKEEKKIGESCSPQSRRQAKRKKQKNAGACFVFLRPVVGRPPTTQRCHENRTRIDGFLGKGRKILQLVNRSPRGRRCRAVRGAVNHWARNVARDGQHQFTGHVGNGRRNPVHAGPRRSNRRGAPCSV